MSTTYTGASLRSYTRQLTGVLTTTTISDAQINQWIDEAYQELALMQRWSWTTAGAGHTVTSLTDGTSPAFSPVYHPLLAYKAASKLLEFTADDTNRGAQFLEEYNKLVSTFIREDILYVADPVIFVAADTDGVNATRMYNAVRGLIQVFDDSISDNAINILFTESWLKFHSTKTWPFAAAGSVGTVLIRHIGTVLGSDAVSMITYDVAAKLTIQLGRPETLTQSFVGRYQELYDKFVRTILISGGSVNANDTTTLAGLVSKVRALAKVYEKDIDDSTIGMFINDAYTTLAAEKDWKWLERSEVVVAHLGDGGLAAISHASLTQAARKILNVFRFTSNAAVDESTPVTNTNKSVEPVYPNPHGMDGLENRSRYTYSIQNDALVAPGFPTVYTTNLYLSPEPTEEMYLKVRYVIEPAPLTTASFVIPFNVRFINYLAYVVAIKVMIYSTGADQKIIPLYQQQAEQLYAAMVDYYQNDHGTEPFQMGANGLDEPRYIPNFRSH